MIAKISNWQALVYLFGAEKARQINALMQKDVGKDMITVNYSDEAMAFFEIDKQEGDKVFYFFAGTGS